MPNNTEEVTLEHVSLQNGSLQSRALELHATLGVELCEGGFAPGETLSIRKIAAKYQTGVMPAREALRWLVAEGALEFASSKKIIVPVHNAGRFEEILYARRSIERELARMAFSHLQDEDMAILAELDDVIDKAIDEDDLPKYMKCNFRFHFHIYQKSGAQVLLSLAQQLWQQYGPSMRYIASPWKNHHIDDDYHQEMIDALRNRDCRKFCDGIAADINQGMSLLKDFS